MIYEHINNFFMNNFEMSLSEVASLYNYSDLNKAIICGDMNYIEYNYPEELVKLNSCIHNRDTRTITQFARDIVASWIMEDYIREQLSSELVQIELGGTDKNRVFSSNNNIKTDPDFLVCVNNAIVKVEFMADYCDAWKRYGTLSLRDNKYLRLKENKSLMLCLDVNNRLFTMIDFGRDDIEANFIASLPQFGNKPVYSLPVSQFRWFNFDKRTFYNYMKKYVDNNIGVDFNE